MDQFRAKQCDCSTTAAVEKTVMGHRCMRFDWAPACSVCCICQDTSGIDAGCMEETSHPALGPGDQTLAVFQKLDLHG